MSLNYEQEWMRYHECNPSMAQLHLQSVIARFELPPSWIHSSKTIFWKALVMEEVYQVQPSRRPSYATGSPNNVDTSSACNVSALDRQNTCGSVTHRRGARNRTRDSSRFVNRASTFRTRSHPCLRFVPMNPSTLRNEIHPSPSPTSHSFTTP